MIKMKILLFLLLSALFAYSDTALEWPGTGNLRRMLYWHNPFPIYDATYIFKVYPRKKIVGAAADGSKYYTTFFWGNDGTFIWDNGNANTYYGAHPYPVPAPTGPGQWETSVYSSDYTTGQEVQWGRWHTQVFRAWRESASITHQEFYFDWPDTTKVIKTSEVDAHWASINPPVPAIVVGQSPDLNGASWGGYGGWEEFNGMIRGMQFYSGLLSLADVKAEIATPKSSTSGSAKIWYFNINPTPTDVLDKSGKGHHGSWDGKDRPDLWTDGKPLAIKKTARTAKVLCDLPKSFYDGHRINFTKPLQIGPNIFDLKGKKMGSDLNNNQPIIDKLDKTK